MNRKKAILKKSIEFTRRVRAIKITLSFGFAVFSVVGLLIAFNLDALRLSRISVSGARAGVAPRMKRFLRLGRVYTTLVVRVRARPPAALWCPAVEQAHCLYLDESGFAFGIAPFFRGDSYLVFTSSRTPAVGSSL